MASSHVVGVTLSTEASSIVLLVEVLTVGGVVLSSVKIVAVIAHALGIVLPVWVSTVRNLHDFFVWIVLTYERVSNQFAF